MEINTYPCIYLCANCYMITEGTHSFLIDPCVSNSLLADIARLGTKVDFALLTHEHSDHISGVTWVQEQLGAPVICSEKCASNLTDIRMNYSRYFETIKQLMGGLGQQEDVKMEPFTCRADHTFRYDHTFLWEGHTVLCKIAPGHSEGGVCYMMDDRLLFAGDAVFEKQETITRFKGGSAEAYRRDTLPWLNSLPLDTRVYPGHFASFTLGNWIGRKRA